MKKIIAGLAVIIFFSGCAHVQPNYSLTMEGAAKRLASYLASGLDESYRGMSCLSACPVDAGTMHAGRFGLSMQELMINALTDEGVNVVDVQLRKKPYITCTDGFVALSRDASRLRDEYRAGVILVSTYITGRHNIVITTRAVDFTTNETITSATTSLLMSPSIMDMLHADQEKRLYER
ncbi:MAG: FlgO family outer membrane protein [Thermodesulfobacteriota bacterium]|nr:FlgO family outer membrane protein [Thermodesulfobacteriota bacterium]